MPGPGHLAAALPPVLNAPFEDRAGMMPTSSVTRSMAIQPSPLCALPLELLVEIALRVVILGSPHGPPKDLLPLLLTCKDIYHSLAFNRCTILYANIYRCSFDIHAPRRRFGDGMLHAQEYAAQLKKCCVALTRIRRADLESETLEDDLWTAWLMALENDGKNGEQLDWARLDDLLQNFILTRLWNEREMYEEWPAESAVNALAVWLFWYRMSQDKLDALSTEQRQAILDLVRPFAIVGPRYPPFHAPDCHFSLPMRPDRALLTDRQKIPTPHGFWPLYRTPDQSIHYVEHYNGQLEITEPLLALGSQLLFFTLYWQPLVIPANIPIDRAHAHALGHNGVCATQQDLLEYNASSPVKLVDARSHWYHRLSDEERFREDRPKWTRRMRSPSAQWECDFNRLIGCVDPYHLRPNTVTYEFGTLTGLWKGLHLNPNPDQYFAAAQSFHFPADFSSDNPRLFMYPVYLQLREHHCISPTEPVPCGGNPNDNDDGINNAWLPPTIEVHEGDDIVRLRDAQHPSQPPIVYETFVEGKKNSHNPDTCTHCVRKQRAADLLLAEKVQRNKDKAFREATSAHRATGPPETGSSDGGDTVHDVRMAMNAALGDGQDVDVLVNEIMSEEASDDDSDDDAEVKANVTCSGIKDILITGQTLPRHGEAWHHFQCYGRIRPWDGLIALVRLPVCPPGRFGVYIFRGYIVGGCNLVGAWRVRTGNTRAVPLEGPFVMSRVE